MRRRQLGLTLTEMMVAITIGLILIAGAASMLVTSKQNYQVQNDLARIQENARFALEQMLYDIRMAGYFGCADNLDEVYNHLNGANGGAAIDVSNPVEGYDGNSDPPRTWLPSGSADVPAGIENGTDAVTVRYLEPTNIAVTAAMPQPSAVLQVAVNNGLQQGEIVAVTDCESADIFQISGPDGDGPSTTGTIVHDTGDATVPGNNSLLFPDCPGKAANCLSKVYDTDARVLRFVARRYFVGDDGNGNPALMRIEADGTSGTATATTVPQVLVDGVENMQILFGEDTSGDRAPDDYRSADEVGQWANVVAVRLALLLRSVEETGSDTDARTYQVGDEQVGPFTDRRRRRVFTTTVVMRNILNNG